MRIPGFLLDRRIATLLTVGMTATVALTVLVLTAADVARQRSIFHAKLVDKGVLLAETLNDSLANALYSRDIQRLRHLGEVVKANPEIRHFSIFLLDGRVLVGPTDQKYPVGTTDDSTIQLILENSEVSVRPSADGIFFAKALVAGGETLGGVQFALDTSTLRAEVAETVIQHAWQGLLVLLLGGALAFFMARILVWPIQYLTELSRSIADGVRDVAVSTEEIGEIGELAESMKDMADRLREDERANAELRAAALRSANDRLQEQQQLLEAKNVELEEKNEELERFSYSISHDLKSPVVTILGFAGLLEKDLASNDSERVKSDLEKIRDAGTHMERQLEELLELSRVGRVVRPKEEVNLNRLAEEAAAQVAGLAMERGVQIEIQPRMPNLVAERARLVELLQNLIENACKFMGPQDQPKVEVGASREDGRVVCFVRDNGIGIEPQYHDKVFDLFERLDWDSDGTGIGLALAKRIIDVQGGRIWVESEGKNLGSTFFFSLPLGD